MMKNLYNSLCCFLAVSMFACTAHAQTFETPDTTNSSTAPQANWLSNPRKTTSTTKPAATKPTDPQPTAAQQPKQVQPAQPAVDMSIPQTQRPTLDGVVRGHVSLEPVMTGVETPLKDDRFIFIYYDNFKIRTTMSGKILCDMRFVVLSTLDRRINNISFRLKWPNIETPISFNDVVPNVDTYVNYTLMGDGCYSLDKTPNIIINRCRVRDMSQQACAEKIRWLKRAN